MEATHTNSTYRLEIEYAAPIVGFATEDEAEKFAKDHLPELTTFRIVTELPMVLA